MWQVGISSLEVPVKTFNCSEISWTISGTNIKVKTLPSLHVLRDFNFKDIDWLDRLNKSGSALSPSEGQIMSNANVKWNMIQITRKRVKQIHGSYTLEGTVLGNVESILVSLPQTICDGVHMSAIFALRLIGPLDS